MTRRLTPGLNALALGISLLGVPSAAASEVGLEVDPCLGLPEAEVRRLTELELATHVVSTSPSARVASSYPDCNRGSSSTHDWFPLPSDCARDPDASSCGESNCSEDSFAVHVFAAHWPNEPGLIGNHCRNRRMDFDETSLDAGGVCDRLGR